jgi:hypothetical protein
MAIRTPFGAANKPTRARVRAPYDTPTPVEEGI